MKIDILIEFNGLKLPVKKEFHLASEEANVFVMVEVPSQQMAFFYRASDGMKVGQAIGPMGLLGEDQNKYLGRWFASFDYSKKYIKKQLEADAPDSVFEFVNAEETLTLSGTIDGSAVPGARAAMQGAGPSDRRSSRGNISEI